MLELEPQDFRNANACLRGRSTSLRAADALHLATASGRGASRWRSPTDRDTSTTRPQAKGLRAT